MKPTLLPSGLMDTLPPHAAAEFRLIHHFLKTFTGFGYEPVIPPLAEHEASLLAGQGEATSHHVFRVADPVAPQMLAIRADMTGQVARIATSILKDAPRPLRLCYAGYTLRTMAEALKTRRQHTQVGIERFGDAEPQSIAEVLSIATLALNAAGIGPLTVDLHYPSVFEALLKDQPKKDHGRLREAARMKDTAALRAAGAPRIADILDISGPATVTLERLIAIANPALETALLELRQLCAALAAQEIDAIVTIDLLDLAGYGYYTGPGYAIYWDTPAIEVGRGGCYRTNSGEDAVGFTLYINEVLDKLSHEKPASVVAIPLGTPAAAAARLQAEGFVTMYANDMDAATLKAQGFSHRLHNGKIAKL